MFRRKKKDPATEQDRKKRKFLTSKFNTTVKGGTVTLPIIAVICTPIALLDGGVSLAIATYMVSAGGITFGLNDKKMQEDILYTNKCGQRIFTKKWVKNLQVKLQKDITKTWIGLNFEPEGSKRHNKLSKRKSELLEIAADLEEYMIVVDDMNKPTKRSVAYITKNTSEDKNADRDFYIYPGRANKSQRKPQPGQ